MSEVDEPWVETDIDKRTILLGQQLSFSAGESDRGYVLFVAAQMDHFLRDIIEAFLIEKSSVSELFDGAYAPLGSLSGKTRMAYFLGLISASERDRINATRKVRNIFAHQIDASFEHKEVAKLCAHPPIFDERLCDRDAFLHMAMNTVLSLAYRSIRVLREWRRIELTSVEANKPD